jgi:hypothetical protein
MGLKLPMKGLSQSSLPHASCAKETAMGGGNVTTFNHNCVWCRHGQQFRHGRDAAHNPPVGQAFADEIFRVYATGHLEMKLTAVNANEQVTRMIGPATAGVRGRERVSETD